MQPYIRCFELDDGLQVISSDARPKNLDPWREVKVGESTRRISVVAGTRLIYAYPDKVQFARMMVEQSEWSSYDEDVRNAQQALEDSTRTGDARYLSFKLNGVSANNVAKNQMTGETLGRTELYFDIDHTLVSVYYINPPVDKARFKSMQDFSSARERFEASYAACVARKRQDWQLFWEKILARADDVQKNGSTSLPLPTPPKD